MFRPTRVILGVGVAFALAAAGSSPAIVLAAGRRIPLAATSSTVKHLCGQRAQRQTFTVLCPALYPHRIGSDVTPSGASLLGRSFYWASFNDSIGFPAEDNGHLIFGGQRQALSLSGSPGQRWPRPGARRPVDQLGLPRLRTSPMQNGHRYVAQVPARILEHATVQRQAALILLAAPYPLGGFMGGHVIVLWNREHHGYMLSFHYVAAVAQQPYTLRERVHAALAIARSSTPLRAAK